jgi:hypothetical protein
LDSIASNERKREFDMARIYDHERASAGREPGSSYPMLPAQRRGRNEMTMLELWGPRGVFVLDGLRHQFTLGAGQEGLADTVHAWLSENAQGNWHWGEPSHPGSPEMLTMVFIADEADIEMFQAKWGRQFSCSERLSWHNRETLKAMREAEASGRLPIFLGPTEMGQLVDDIDGDTSAFLAEVRYRPTFDDLFLQAVSVRCYTYLKWKPSDPMTDEVKDKFAKIGSWLAAYGSTDLRDGVADLVKKEAYTSVAAYLNGPA